VIGLTDSLTIHDLTLLHTPSNTLILGDTHIGEEDALNHQGVFVPKFAFEDLYKRTQSVLDETTPDRIVLNGDVKHNFGRISDDEWDNVFTYVELLSQYGDISVVRGNHDVLLDPITEREGLHVEPYVRLDDILVCHGHERVEKEAYEAASTVVLGHEHPSVTLRQGERHEQFKAFMKGELDGKTVVIMPSMNQLREGSDLLQEQLLSPYLDSFDVMGADVYLVGEDKSVKPFGQLSNLRAMT
jgi:putative SbcD/Mre11-related phosphoesterase